MNIRNLIDVIESGGPGSGPNAPCPQCGPKTKNSEGHDGPHDTERDVIRKSHDDFRRQQKTRSEENAKKKRPIKTPAAELKERLSKGTIDDPEGTFREIKKQWRVPRGPRK